MSSDMTIDTALSDPMIRAMLRADGVEQQAFERLLRSTATTLGRRVPDRVPSIVASRPVRASLLGFCCA